MTDNCALLLNLIELSESGKADFKLELSTAFYNLKDFVIRRHVYIDGTSKFDVTAQEIQDLDVDVMGKYTRPGAPYSRKEK